MGGSVIGNLGRCMGGPGGFGGTEFRERNESVLMQTGTLVAHDQGRGWEVDLSGVRAGVAGGEVQLNGLATGSGSQWQLGLDVEGNCASVAVGGLDEPGRSVA